MLSMIALLGPLSMGIFLPAFPHISLEWNIRNDGLAIAMSAYMLGTALGQLLYGPFIDRLGPFRPLMIGVAIYFVAALMCYLSFDVNTLSIARFIQALGACATGLATRVVVRNTYPPSEVSNAFSTLTMVMAVSPIIAPIVGDLIISRWGWRSNFLLLGFFAVVIALISWFFFPRLSGEGESTFTKSKLLEQYSVIFRNDTFIFYTLILSFSSACPMIFSSASASVFMDNLDLTRSEYVVVYGICGSGLVVGAMVNKWLLKEMPSDRLIIFSLCAQLVLMVFGVVYLKSHSQATFTIILLAFLFLALQGLVTPNATALSMSEFTGGIGSVSSLNLSIAMLVSAYGTYLVSRFSINAASDVFGIMFLFIFLALAFALVYQVRLKNNISHPQRDIYLLLGEGK